MGKKSEKEYVCVCITESLSIFLKPIQHCHLIILQFKKIKELSDTRRAYAKELRPTLTVKREDLSKQNKK